MKLDSNFSSCIVDLVSLRIGRDRDLFYLEIFEFINSIENDVLIFIRLTELVAVIDELVSYFELNEDYESVLNFIK